MTLTQTFLSVKSDQFHRENCFFVSQVIFHFVNNFNIISYKKYRASHHIQYVINLVFFYFLIILGCGKLLCNGFMTWPKQPKLVSFEYLILAIMYDVHYLNGIMYILNIFLTYIVCIRTCTFHLVYSHILYIFLTWRHFYFSTNNKTHDIWQNFRNF